MGIKDFFGHKKNALFGQFEDIHKRELQVYLLAKRVLDDLTELKLILTGKIEVSEGSLTQPVDRLNHIALYLTQIMNLTHLTFREAEKGEKIARESEKYLRDLVVELQQVQINLTYDRLKKAMQNDLNGLEIALRLQKNI